MAELAARLSRRMGLAESDVSAIVEAARLHDIGLYAMSPTYHSSPGPLSFEQRLDLWRHSVIGEQQMARREATRHAQLLVRWHHEWWNGTGYPDQLAFEDIPIGARILRAVELYVALISDRPYRAAHTEETAAAALAAAAGVECDPYVIAALLELVNEYRELPVEFEQHNPMGAPNPTLAQTVAVEQPEPLELEVPLAEPSPLAAAPAMLEAGSREEVAQPFSTPLIEQQSVPAPLVEQSPVQAPLIEQSSVPSSIPPPFIGPPSLPLPLAAEKAPERLLRRLRAASDSNAEVRWRRWNSYSREPKTILGFEASVLRQIEFRSIAIPYWSTARLDWYLKAWDKQIFANDPSAWRSMAARAMVQSLGPLTEDQISRVLDDVYVPGARLSNRSLTHWFSEPDAWWLDNLRRNIEKLEEEAQPLATLIGMQTGDYALSFDDATRDLRQPLTTAFWRLAGRAVTLPGRGRNQTSNLPVEEFIRHTKANLLYLKLPPVVACSSDTSPRHSWRESWVRGGEPEAEVLAPAPQSKSAYLTSVDKLLRMAGHFDVWAIGYQENGPATAHEIAELIKEHRPVRVSYSKDLTEVIGGTRTFIIVGGNKKPG
jgi:hypothetical protein